MLGNKRVRELQCSEQQKKKENVQRDKGNDTKLDRGKGERIATKRNINTCRSEKRAHACQHVHTHTNLTQNPTHTPTQTHTHNYTHT